MVPSIHSNAVWVRASETVPIFRQGLGQGEELYYTVVPFKEEIRKINNYVFIFYCIYSYVFRL